MTERTNWPAGSLNRVLAGTVGVGGGRVALGVAVLAEAGAGEVGEPLTGAVELGADDGAEVRPEHAVAVSTAAVQSTAGIPLSPRIEPA